MILATVKGTAVSLVAKGPAEVLNLAYIIIYIKWFNDHYNGRYMRTSRTSIVLPIPVKRALRTLGQDIRDARKRRRIPEAVAAERASISRTTLVKIEKGDPGVALGLYATVLFVLGMVDRLADVAAARHDALGLQLEEEELPKRIRTPRKPRRGSQ